MALITMQEVVFGFGGAPLLDHINLQIEPGERVCLVGRNGEGKSTLMKLIGGEVEADSGRIIRQKGIRTARLSQEVADSLSGTVYEVVAGGLEKLFGLLSRHHTLTNRMATGTTDRLLAELAANESELAAADAWTYQQRIATVLSRLDLDAERDFNTLSGGRKRQVLLARALVSDPDLLLLDEPTNHLDIEAITWLEEFLLTGSFTLLFVTHDRELLKKLATRILDLDRGRLTSWPGDYPTFLRRKEELLSTELAQQGNFDKKLAQEEAWIRQGIKARRTRNEGRVRALVELRRQREARREQLGRVRMEVTEAGVSGKLVARLENVSLGFEGATVLKGVTTTVLRGDKIGIIGPNGAGKTTLLRLLLGELAPDHGKIKLGTNLLPVYFDQQRAQLAQDKSVADNIAAGSEFIETNGRRRHVIGYLRDFLFAPDRARSPVSVLSGGERNRLLLAQLFARPSNILVLDEPTNDLDVETLELLEELLMDYSGTVLLVSHDRTFLNNVVTSSLVFEGNGQVREYAGGYDDWLRQRPRAEAAPAPVKEIRPERTRRKPAGPRKLTFRELRELEQLPQDIEAMEAEQQQLYDDLADPGFYQESGDRVPAVKIRLAELEERLAAAYGRWEELEAVKDGVAD